MAIAGFYYFSNGQEFVNCAKKVIINDSRVDNHFYLSSVLNEFILENKKIIGLSIKNDLYHTFYSPQKIAEYEKNNE